ncbi:hypothetical protein SAMN06265379_11248 [Saccharicrinis carchari]|uniref:Lipoprotein n=1 Tax=Saccharicrinis carchari TaxID=1168039 RepID=A0A521F049_SACCC|nr:hypothetical protein [Saccharicrinis carchari]SMO89509.1 hypothetical protein SAMN06265379_11248 [Saccharicrinis carchari]
MKNVQRTTIALILLIFAFASCEKDENNSVNIIDKDLPTSIVGRYWGVSPNEVSVGDVFTTIYIGDIHGRYSEYGITVSYFKKYDSETAPILFIDEIKYESYHAYEKENKIYFEDRASKQVILIMEQVNFSVESGSSLIEYGYNEQKIKQKHYSASFD